jgi:mannose/fructose-specific phosphotransferase system component IIA
MSVKHLTFIVAHEDIARALYGGVQSIIGQQENVYVFSNKKDSLPLVAQKMEKYIVAANTSKMVCFTDLMGGSCWTVANMVQKKYPRLVVVSGVNLPMLITYFNNISTMEFSELIDKTKHDACRGIQVKSD